MRITPVTNTYGRNLTPQKQVSFGYLADKPKGNETADEFLKRTKDEREEIIRLLPPLGDKVLETLITTPAVVLKRQGDRVNGELNKDYEGVENYLDLSGEDEPDTEYRKFLYRLGDLQIEKNFIRFWNCFLNCQDNEQNPHRHDNYTPPRETKQSDFDYASDIAWNHYKW